MAAVTEQLCVYVFHQTAQSPTSSLIAQAVACQSRCQLIKLPYMDVVMNDLDGAHASFERKQIKLYRIGDISYKSHPMGVGMTLLSNQGLATYTTRQQNILVPAKFLE
jgi:hypothetical protein